MEYKGHIQDERTAGLAAEIRQSLIENMPNADKMLEFLRDNQLKLAWEQKQT